MGKRNFNYKRNFEDVTFSKVQTKKESLNALP